MCAKRFYNSDDVYCVKHDEFALRSELEPAKRGRGSGDKMRYVCPACQRDATVRVYRGNRDGSAVWACVACGKAGNIIDLFVLRGQTVTDCCDRWADDGSVSSRGRVSYVVTGQRNDDVVSTVQVDDFGASPVVDQTRRSWLSVCQPYCMSAKKRLWGDAGRAGLQWLRDRGLADAIIDRFGLGYDSKAMKRGVAGGGLPYGRAGVIIPYDRLMSYFAARFLEPMVIAGKEVKINMPDAGFVGHGEPLFNRSALWYYDVVVVVEGQIDAISIAQAAESVQDVKVGALSVNGAMNHAEIIRELSRKPTRARLLVALDGDDSGHDGAQVLSHRLHEIGQAHEVIDGSVVYGGWSGCKDAGDVLKLYDTDTLAVSIETMLHEPAVKMPEMLPDGQKRS